MSAGWVKGVSKDGGGLDVGVCELVEVTVDWLVCLQGISSTNSRPYISRRCCEPTADGWTNT